MKKKTNRMGEETMQCKCNVCKKEMHCEEAIYCTRCGTKLDLEKAISRTGRHHH